jgi:uncharacterized protein (DUF486 family)
VAGASGPDTLEGRRQEEEGMIIALYIVAAVVMAVGSLFFAWQNRDFRKFLAGAFFVSSGILFYFYLADVSVPLLGTSFVETPQISGGRSIVHFHPLHALFLFWLRQEAKDLKRTKKSGRSIGPLMSTRPL